MNNPFNLQSQPELYCLFADLNNKYNIKSYSPFVYSTGDILTNPYFANSNEIFLIFSLYSGSSIIINTVGDLTVELKNGTKISFKVNNSSIDPLVVKSVDCVKIQNSQTLRYVHAVGLLLNI